MAFHYIDFRSSTNRGYKIRHWLYVFFGDAATKSVAFSKFRPIDEIFSMYVYDT